jgi:hypothetical protein
MIYPPVLLINALPRDIIIHFACNKDESVAIPCKPGEEIQTCSISILGISSISMEMFKYQPSEDISIMDIVEKSRTDDVDSIVHFVLHSQCYDSANVICNIKISKGVLRLLFYTKYWAINETNLGMYMKEISKEYPMTPFYLPKVATENKYKIFYRNTEVEKMETGLFSKYMDATNLSSIVDIESQLDIDNKSEASSLFSSTINEDICNITVKSNHVPPIKDMHYVKFFNSRTNILGLIHKYTNYIGLKHISLI